MRAKLPLSQQYWTSTCSVATNKWLHALPVPTYVQPCYMAIPCRRYSAIVVGRLDGCGRVEKPLGGKSALTTFKAERHVQSMLHGGGVTLVSLWPHTGRTHQLRRHMAHLGKPILGDDRYMR
jgi:hypothetical protein